MAPYPLIALQCVEVGIPVWLHEVGLCSGSHKAETKMPPGLCPHRQRAHWLLFTLIHMQSLVWVTPACWHTPQRDFRQEMIGLPVFSNQKTEDTAFAMFHLKARL